MYYEDKEKDTLEVLECFWWVVKVIVIVTVLICAALYVAGEEEGQTYVVTAYCPCSRCCGRWANVFPRRTASGHIIKEGDKFVAAPKGVPFGTILCIPGYGTVRVEDRGGAIKEGRLDVFFPTHKEARIWGKQRLRVKMMAKPRLE